MLEVFGQHDLPEQCAALQRLMVDMADASTESGVFGTLTALLRAVGSGGGLFFEARHAGRHLSDEHALGQHLRVWPLLNLEHSQTGARPQPVPLTALPPELLNAERPARLNRVQAGVLAQQLTPQAEHEAATRRLTGSRVLPLWAGDRLLGTFVAVGQGQEAVGEAEPDQTGPGDAMLTMLAVQAAQALEGVRQRSRLSLLDTRIQALEHANIGLFQTDAAGQILWFNTRFQEITELRPERQHDLWAYLVPGHERQRFSAWWQDSLLGRRVPHHQFALLSPGGGTRWVEASSTPTFAGDGQVNGQIGTLEDITERRVVQERLTFQAHHDPLTQLPNRAFLAQVWPQLQASAQGSGHLLALLFIDLERFKQVNDSLGHQVGDQLLTLVARRLQTSVGHQGIVVRHGGDEFVVLLRNVRTRQEAEEAAHALLDELQIPIRIDHHVLRVQCRAGLSLYPEDADDLPMLLRQADAAMYRLKHVRRSGVLAYTREMRGGGLEQLHLESEFRQALKRSELRLHYQSKWDLKSGRQVGWEALVRWQHPVHGLMYPGAFLPMVAESGLLQALGDWVLTEAHRQTAVWLNEGKPALRVAVNVDARQLMPGHLPQLIRSLQKTHALPANLLEVELTEEALHSEVSDLRHDLTALQEAGITVAIDDFGCGFSNLRQLQRLHVDRIKIDCSYVAHLEHSASDRAIVQAAVSVGHALGAKVLAEGIETPEQLALLRDLSCDEGQGYLWAMPRPPDELEWPR